MRVRMIVTKKGSPDPCTVNTYQEGQEYEVPAPLGTVFVREGWAEEVKPEHPAASRATKVVKPKSRKK